MAEKQKKWKIVIILMVALLAVLCAWSALNHQRSVRVSAMLSPGFGEATPPHDTALLQGLTVPPMDELATVIKKVCQRPILGYEISQPPMGNAFSASKADASPLEKGNAITRERKKRLGIDKSLDLIVQPNERFTIGGTRVSMRDILAKAVGATGGLLEEEIDASGQITVDVDGEYGIYVVRQGDNIWNIHFKIVQEYFSHRGTDVIKTADEPLPGGLSSGVGKLLKFSEKMVIIYNLLEGSITSNIDLLEPLSKIVVYNMHEIFSLLQEIDYNNVDNIRFDGDVIWIPAKQP